MDDNLRDDRIEELAQKIRDLQDRNKKLEREVASLKAGELCGSIVFVIIFIVLYTVIRYIA